VREVVEREEKWDVDDRFEVPDLASGFGATRVDEDTVDLVSEYYDTPERDLQAHRVLVRRRSGEDDTGWQVKLPAADGRTELQWPLTDKPPKSLRDVLVGVSLGKPLDQLATVHTVRSRHRFYADASEEVSAELADDRVRAVVAGEVLRRMGVAAGTTVGENGFTFGLLLAREQRIAQECRTRARELAG